jgi:hypothetical protein
LEIFLFAFAVFFSTFTLICSKTMMSMLGTNGATPDGVCGKPIDEPFSKPLFQTFGMFVGMTFGLVMHAAAVGFRVPFPGYNHPTGGGAMTPPPPGGHIDNIPVVVK